MQAATCIALDTTTRVTLPGAYARSFSPIGRSNNTHNSRRNSYTTRKGSPGVSRSSRTSQKRQSSVNTASDSGEQAARSNSSGQAVAARLSSAVQSSLGGHYYSKSRHNGGSLNKYHNSHQQGSRRGAESLPPRLRNSVENNGNKKHYSSGKKSSTSSSSNNQARGGSKNSSTKQSSSSAERPSPAPSMPPTISTSPSQAETEKEAGERNSVNNKSTTVDMIPSSSECHQKMRSSADSGHFDDLSSSCESDLTSMTTSNHQQQEEVELVSMVSSSGVESDHPGSDVCDDDDVFVDALSSIPSENSSAYVTPYSTRSQSPAPPDLSDNALSNNTMAASSDPASSLDSQSSIERVCDSLQKILDLRQPASSSSSNTVELDADTTSPTSEAVERCSLESCDSQVTMRGSSKGEGSLTESASYLLTFTHPSLVFDVDGDGETCQPSKHSPREFRTRPRYLSKEDTTDVYIGDMELDVSSDADDADSAVDFVITSRSPSCVHEDDEEDSGCATSIGSPDKASSSLDFKRPGLLHIPIEVLLHMEENNYDLDSVIKMNASESCSLELSGGHGVFEGEEEKAQELKEKEDGDDVVDGSEERVEDEWPDLFAEENQTGRSSNNNLFPMMFNHPGASVSPMHPLEGMNGFVHPPFPLPPMPPSSSICTKPGDSDPSQIMASINSHVRQQQQAVYQQHHNAAMMFGNGGYPVGPPPPPHPPFGHMFTGPTGFMGFYPPPPMFPLGPGFPPLPPHSMGLPPPPLAPPPVMAPPTMPPQPHPPSSQSPVPSNDDDESQDSSVSHQSSPEMTPTSISPPLSPVLCEKHHLCSRWVMWYDKITGSSRGPMSDYKDTLKNVSTIDSIENFWGTYNNILPPSGLDRCSNYHFFKEGIYPLWEDEANEQGGKWVLTIKDDPRSLDQAWMEVLLMLIGGGMKHFDNVNGVVVSRRKKGDRISLWTKKRAKKASLDVCVELVRALCVAFEVPSEGAERFVQELADNQHGISLGYLYHSDSLKSGSSYSNEQHIKLKDYVDAILQDL